MPTHPEAARMDEKEHLGPVPGVRSETHDPKHALGESNGSEVPARPRLQPIKQHKVVRVIEHRVVDDGNKIDVVFNEEGPELSSTLFNAFHSHPRACYVVLAVS